MFSDIFILLLVYPYVLGVWLPSSSSTFQWQLSGTVDVHVQASVFDVDLFDTSDSAFNQLKSAGHHVICYFSAGSAENWRNDYRDFPGSVLGHALDGWHGEVWLDIRSSAVLDVMRRRLDLAQRRGCDGIEPDNVDGYSNNNGFGLHFHDQLVYNKWLANEGRQRGMSVGLKNDVDQISHLAKHFDWALNEQCLQYDECDKYAPFLQEGKVVFNVEYVDHHSQGAAKQSEVCHSRKRPPQFITLIKDLDVTAWRMTC